MFQKKRSSNKKVVKGFTLVEIIVVLVILAILAAATIPSMLGFIDDAKFKTIDNEARVVRNAAQAYATEQSAKGETDEKITNDINGVINSDHVLHRLLQNDANGTVFMTEVKDGKIKKFNYTKEIIDQDEDFISNKVRYVVFDDEKTSLLHATDPITNINIDNFKAKIIEEVTKSLMSNDPESFKSTLTSSLNSSLDASVADMATSLNSSIDSKIAASKTSLKTNFATELGSLVYPVGSYYITNDDSENKRPSVLFGGTWVRVEDEFLYCMSATNAKKPDNTNIALSVGGTGGSKTHKHTTGDWTLTIDQIPSHSHPLTSTARVMFWDPPASSSYISLDGLGTGTRPFGHNGFNQGTQIRGGDQAHNHGDTGLTYNIPPYIAVYCWRRTA